MKRIVLLLLCAAVLLAAACTNQTPVQSETPVQEEPGGEEPVQEEPAGEDPAATEEQPEDTNTLETALFTFIAPESWGENFGYIEGENGVQFFSFSARGGDSDGLLCWIGTYPDMSDEQAHMVDETYYIGEKDGSSYLMTYPVDVDYSRFSYDVAEEYRAMLDALPELAASVKLK